MSITRSKTFLGLHQGNHLDNIGGNFEISPEEDVSLIPLTPWNDINSLIWFYWKSITNCEKQSKNSLQ